MATLESLNGGGGANIDSFSVEEQKTPVVNVPSVKNVAAHYAMLSDNPEEVYGNYQQINADMGIAGQSELMDQIQQRAASGEQTYNRKELVGMLTSDQYTDDQKRNAANTVLDSTSNLYSNKNMLAVKAAQQPSAGETQEAELSRVDVAAAIQEVNQARDFHQAMYNSAMTANDGNTLESVKGFMETLLPFSESTQVAAINKEFQEGGNMKALKDVLLSGEAKQDIIDSLRRLPPAERLTVTQHLLDSVENNNGAIYLPDQNKFQTANLLKQFVNGDYSSADRWLDNIVSLLDTTVLGGSIVRGVSRAGRALRGASRAEETAEVAEDVVAVDRLAPEETPENFAVTERRMADKAERGVEGVPDSISAQAYRNVEVEAPKVFEQPNGTQKYNKGKQKRYEKELAKEERRLRIEARRNTDRSMVRNQTQPSTVSQTLKDVNPQKSRQAFELAASDETGEAAQALYGASRTEAVANDMMPEVGKVGGNMTNKTHRPNKSQEELTALDPELRSFLDNTGAIHYTSQEKRLARARVSNNFAEALGLTNRTEMMAVTDTPEGMRIQATYAPSEGGFASAQDAIEQTKFALRDFGVTDADLTLMRREGSDYVPTTLDEARTLGSTDHQVMINHKYEIGADSIEDWTNLDVKRNVFDRIPIFSNNSNGSLNRHLLDPASTLHPTIVRGASVAVDRSAGLESKLSAMAKEFSDVYVNLDKGRQQLVEQTIKKANQDSHWPSNQQLITDGFTETEVNTLGKWKEYWDNMYHLENKDLVRTLRNRNYHMIEDAETDTRLFARPMSKANVSGGQKVYDYRNDRIVQMSSDEIAELYEKGGQLGQLRSPIRAGNDAAELIISEGKAGGPYFRRLNDDDRVLNYREGYYTVRYEAPHFIIKREKDAKGNILFERAVAAAGSVQEADHAVKRMIATDGGDYYRRGDIKGDFNQSSEYWDMQQASGRSSQRVRGQRLEDSSGNLNDKGIDHAYVQSPAESMQQSARSMASRASMRDYMEATKARFTRQYQEFLPKDRFGRTQFPSKAQDIQKTGRMTDSDVADARTTFEYIKFLEEGYINSIDEGARQALKALANVSGKIPGMAGQYAEKGLNWAAAQRSPTNIAKTMAFQLYLALNPQRQLIVQGHQAMQLLAIHPRYAMSKMGNDFSLIMAAKLGADDRVLKQMTKTLGRSPEEVRTMLKQMQETGLLDSVDKHNLVRGSLTELVTERHMLSRYNIPGRAYTKAVDIGRRAGFDVGENFNMTTAWLTFRDRAVRAGKELNSETLAEIAADARNYTYNMNRAGDMPYNSNIGAMVAQFMQVPHKAFLQVVANRQLTPFERTRIGVFNAVMYGLPASLVYGSMGSILPDNPEIKQVLARGLESAMLNKALSLTFDMESDIDFKSIAPTDLEGLYEFMAGVVTTDAKSLFSESPSVQAMGRIGELGRVAGRYFNIVDDYEQSPTTYMEVIKATAELSSGFSNAFRAKMAVESSKKFSASGKVTSDQSNAISAVANVFGFNTIDEAYGFDLSNELYQKSNEYKEDVTKWYEQYRKHLSRQGITVDEEDFIIKALGEGQRAFKDSPRAMGIIRQQLSYDVANKKDWLFQSMLKNVDIMDRDEMKSIAQREFRNDPEKYQSFAETLDTIYDWQGEE